MEAFIIVAGIIFLLILFGAVASAHRDEKRDREKYQARQEKRDIAEQNRKQESKELYDNFISRYGECTTSVSWKGWKEWSEINMEKLVLVFDEYEIIVIKSKEYKFSDILGYSLEDNVKNETVAFSEGKANTSTSSMLGRAAVGGLLTGGLGAVAGAATAKKNISTDSVSTTKTTHNYVMYININNLQDPVITLRIGDMSGKAQKLASILNIIIERNKQHQG